MDKFNLETIESQVMEFDKMKFVDEDGVEKISGRDLSKALGYTDWRNFKKAKVCATSHTKTDLFICNMVTWIASQGLTVRDYK